MKYLRAISISLGISFVVAIFLPVAFSPLEQADAYRASDFVKQMEQGSYQSRKARRTYNPILRPIRSQRGRGEGSAPVSSTVKYLESKASEESTAMQWLYSRSNELMSICREKYPTDIFMCFQRNHRLLQRQGIAVNFRNVK